KLPMMSVIQEIKEAAVKSIKALYNVDLNAAGITVSATKPEFEGDYTIVLFSFVKQLKKSPDVLGNEIGEFLIRENALLFSGYNVIKGFLNLVVTDQYWLDFLQDNFS